jgi:CRP-like cAMP-binding protein
MVLRGNNGENLTAPPHPDQSVAAGAEGNRLLASLPAAILGRLERHFSVVHVQKKEVIFRAREPLTHVYFPTTAVLSLVSTLESGQSLEVGIVGRDGVAGPAAFPGTAAMSCDGVVQIPGAIQQMSTASLCDELLESEVLHSTIARYAQLLLARSMQIAACNVFHSVEQRCIRWLLTVSDLIDQDDVPLTHELMATMLGVHRPTVTVVLRALHKRGLVDERRGRILIRDRGRLHDACCECYAAMRGEQRRLMGY